MSVGRDRDQDDRPRWLAAGVVIAILAVWIVIDEDGYLRVLDDANLAFHEAGHPFFGALFGRTLGLYGGTLGQLVFPVVALGCFAHRRQLAQASIAAAWLGENCMNIARYMADARSQDLPLVGGGEHDWANIFGRWHCLMRDHDIAHVTRSIGWTLFAVPFGYVCWRGWQAHQRALASPPV